MFSTFLFSKNLKYVGVAIVSIILLITLSALFSNIYDSTLSFFGVETKDEKIEKFSNNNNILKDTVETNKKYTEFVTKQKDVVIETIVDTKTKLDDIGDKADVIKEEFATKVKNINTVKTTNESKIIKNNVSETIESKPLPKLITIVSDEYKKAGTIYIDTMESMYNMVLNI